MRYFEAGTLKTRMEAGPLSLEEIDRVFTQLADALGYAHARGIVHRDLKPANALVDEDGNLFLTDFGIAKLLESASPRLTQTDAIMGTPAYISPEQAQAQPVDRRSDIYSLGIILYEMVTGRVPFMADTPLAVILKHVSDPLPLPSMVKAGIPPAIEQVLLKALAKNPDDRFGSTAEFVSAWKRALREMETLKREPQTPSVPLSAMETVADEARKAQAPAPRQTLPPHPAPNRPASITQTLTKTSKPATGLAIGCVALLCLGLSAAGVFVFASGMLNQPTPTPVPPTPVPIQPSPVPPPTDTQAPPSNVFLQDDFSEESWGTLTDSDNAIEYVNGALNMIIYTDNWFVWSTPNSEIYEDIHMEVTVINNNTDPNTAFGLMCHQQTDGNTSYYFAITPNGQYVIARAASGQDDVFLTSDGAWGNSDAIPQGAVSYRVGADCGIDGALTLYVNGQEVDSVTDTSYTSGSVGLIAWSTENASNTNVSFDDFLLTDLP
jgi:serine/threonine protein kinase